MYLRTCFVAGLLLFLSACAAPSGSPHQSVATAPNAGPSVDWDHPLEGSVAVASIDQARGSLSFDPRQPEGLGTPLSIFVSASSRVPEPRHRGLAFVYDLPDYGRAVVAETLLQISVADWERNIDSDVSRNGLRGVPTTAERVTVRGGASALLLTDATTGRSAIEWVEGTVKFVIMGPALTRSACLELAERV